MLLGIVGTAYGVVSYYQNKLPVREIEFSEVASSTKVVSSDHPWMRVYVQDELVVDDLYLTILKIKNNGELEIDYDEDVLQPLEIKVGRDVEIAAIVDNQQSRDVVGAEVVLESAGASSVGVVWRILERGDWINLAVVTEGVGMPHFYLDGTIRQLGDLDGLAPISLERVKSRRKIIGGIQAALVAAVASVVLGGVSAITYVFVLPAGIKNFIETNQDVLRAIRSYVFLFLGLTILLIVGVYMSDGLSG